MSIYDSPSWNLNLRKMHLAPLLPPKCWKYIFQINIFIFLSCLDGFKFCVAKKSKKETYPDLHAKVINKDLNEQFRVFFPIKTFFWRIREMEYTSQNYSHSRKYIKIFVFTFSVIYFIHVSQNLTFIKWNWRSSAFIRMWNL